MEQTTSTKIKYPIAGYAPGSYGNECTLCKEDFMGDKYARQCEPCAINYINESHVELIRENSRIKTALRGIKQAEKVIDNILKEYI